MKREAGRGALEGERVRGGARVLMAGLAATLLAWGPEVAPGMGRTPATRAAAAAEVPPRDLSRLPLEELRQRLKDLDAAHTAALEAEDHEGSAEILREINRLQDELVRRHLRPRPERPPVFPAPRR